MNMYAIREVQCIGINFILHIPKTVKVHTEQYSTGHVKCVSCNSLILIENIGKKWNHSFIAA